MDELRLWLVGSGIAGSPSPAMQNAALRARGLAGSYELRDVGESELGDVIAGLRHGGLRGANVTIPHKMTMARACDSLEGDAPALGAVNTVTVEAGKLLGSNTDVRGFELALRRQGLWPAPGARAVVLGAGGAAAAVVLALLRLPAAGIVVSGRRAEAAQRLAARFAAGAPVVAVPWSGEALGPPLEAADLVVNATPVGLAGLPLDPSRLGPGCAVSDLRYRPRPVDLVAAARAAGRRGGDGAEMLLQQGMLSFTRWTGAEPPWDEARAALEAALSP